MTYKVGDLVTIDPSWLENWSLQMKYPDAWRQPFYIVQSYLRENDSDMLCIIDTSPLNDQFSFDKDYRSYVIKPYLQVQFEDAPEVGLP